MREADYLIIGSSHAALSALHTLRMHDTEGSVTMVTRDATLPYSPTVLPYVVSGRSSPERVFLRDEAYFQEHKVELVRGKPVERVAVERSAVVLSNGEEIGYRKLLVASGARPIVPPIPGLDRVRFHVLRTLDDAVDLRDALSGARRALVLGAGLVGMHAAENLAKAGAAVTIVEMQPHVLPGYFDADAAAIISSVFEANGVRLCTGARVVGVAPLGSVAWVDSAATPVAHGASIAPTDSAQPSGCTVVLDSGESIDCDLLVVGVGVVPVTDFLADSGVQTDRGVLVDDRMCSSVPNIWAAGDVAQARGFYDEAKTLNGILPDAVEQGRIAGMAMAGDPGLRPYPGGVPLNTYTFFGQRAVSVGVHSDGQPDSPARDSGPADARSLGDGQPADGRRGLEVVAATDRDQHRYLKIVLRDDRLLGIFGINVAFDPGVMWELILRRIDLGPVRERFLESPQDAARVLMSRNWR